MKHSKEVNNIQELFEAIKSIQSAYPYTLWYRGHANSSWQLKPSVQRNNLKNYERNIANSFYHRASQIMANKFPKKSYDQWVSLMQHYGVPSRLLDWTYSPLVALYFSLSDMEKYKSNSGCIWILYPNLLNKLAGFDSHIYPIDSTTALNMLKPIFTGHYVANELTEKKILACFSVSADLRIYSQKSAFTIHGTNTAPLERMFNTYLYKLIIPSSRKEYFKDVLNTFGIIESAIFPDYEHISKDIIQKYKQKKD